MSDDGDGWGEPHFTANDSSGKWMQEVLDYCADRGTPSCCLSLAQAHYRVWRRYSLVDSTISFIACAAIALKQCHDDSYEIVDSLYLVDPDNPDDPDSSGRHIDAEMRVLKYLYILNPHDGGWNPLADGHHPGKRV